MPLATLQEYRDWAGDQAALPTARDLAAASSVVLRATRGAVYATTTGGTPTDPALVVALRDAACAQVARRLQATAASALQQAGLKSASIGSAAYTVADAVAAPDPELLSDEAWGILHAAGLIGGPVVVVG